MSTKRLIYGISGVAIIAGVAYWWYRERMALKAQVPPPPVREIEAITNTAPTKPTEKPLPVPPSGKQVPASEVLKAGPDAIANKTLIARYSNLGIYDTVMKKVGTTLQGKVLGKAFKANPASNGTYHIKFTDENGEFRIVNSSSVNVI